MISFIIHLFYTQTAAKPTASAQKKGFFQQIRGFGRISGPSSLCQPVYQRPLDDEDLLASSEANKEMNDKKRALTSSANFARSRTVTDGSCKDNLLGCENAARVWQRQIFDWRYQIRDRRNQIWQDLRLGRQLCWFQRWFRLWFVKLLDHESGFTCKLLRGCDTKKSIIYITYFCSSSSRLLFFFASSSFSFIPKRKAAANTFKRKFFKSVI